MVPRSVIVSAARTPFGKLGGGLSRKKATELGSLDDVEATIALIVAFARRLGREQTFLR